MANTDQPPQTKRPSSSAFKQQRLPAWQPILTAGTVLPTFFVIGIAFIPVGIGLLYFSEDVREVMVDYTDCMRVPDTDDELNKTCASFIQGGGCDVSCSCNVSVTVDKPLRQDVYIYYGLTNYYQNHRRYVKSRDDNQLLGNLASHKPSSDCGKNFSYDGNVPIAPCGAIANSFFNDSFILYAEGDANPVPLLRTGIAWPSDKRNKFRNPKGSLQEALKGYAKPINWCHDLTKMDPDDPSNNGFENEDFIVWMRTAALPTFRKLHRRLNHTGQYEAGLPQGKYILNVQYNYPVTEFHGRKLFIIATTSLLGGKNPFLGIAYIVVGSICLVLGIMFLVVHLKYGRSSAQAVAVNQETPY